MTSFRILHVDDDPLMRDIVELSLGLDPGLLMMACASGEEALAAVDGWQPHLILCDVMMPDMDGPALLARLRERADTANTPVAFITARAPADEIERLKSLGAVAVIVKPFDPATLAAMLRRHLHAVKLASAADNFSQRLRASQATLAAFRENLPASSSRRDTSEDLQSFVHKLAGAAGIFGHPAVSAAAAALEEAIIETRAGRGRAESVATHLDTLLESIPRTQATGAKKPPGDGHDGRIRDARASA